MNKTALSKAPKDKGWTWRATSSMQASVFQGMGFVCEVRIHTAKLIVGGMNAAHYTKLVEEATFHTDHADEYERMMDEHVKHKNLRDYWLRYMTRGT